MPTTRELIVEFFTNILPMQNSFLFRKRKSNWSGLRGSNPPPRPWQGRALPNELNPQEWCLRSELNQRHGDFQSPALPTELQRRDAFFISVLYYNSTNAVCQAFFSIFLKYFLAHNMLIFYSDKPQFVAVHKCWEQAKPTPIFNFFIA